MTDAEALDALGPMTKAMGLASGHAQQIANLLRAYRERMGEDEVARTVEQIESVFTAAQRGARLACYTYDHEMVTANLVRNIAAFCGYEVNDNDDEEALRSGSALINIQYTASDEDGKPCVAIRVNQ